MYIQKQDDLVLLKSSQALYNYDDVKYFKEDPKRLDRAITLMKKKKAYAQAIQLFLQTNDLLDLSLYQVFKRRMEDNLTYTNDFFVTANYTSPAGRKSAAIVMPISRRRIQELETDKSILMSKSEYNRYIKEQEKEQLERKKHSYYERVNKIIDTANANKECLVIENANEELDRLINSLFDRTVNSIKKVKTIDSEEWDMLDDYITSIEAAVNTIVEQNDRILAYYNSDAFLKIKTTCDMLMSAQQDFNAYILEKVQSIGTLFGTAVVRNETVIEDEYNYIHTYKKSITPFAAEVSASVFASAENNPLDYVIKYFYPVKERYPEQIQKLQTLIEEIETLKEAKKIIENYKASIQQYFTEVPEFIMRNDEDGFYLRLGFATINESTLVVSYKFSYTSNGGKAQRSFTVPMTEETIVKLIEKLESKLTMAAFTKEQRSLMTIKLRQSIKERDDYTCKFCGNSIYKEPNLLLEIDHIVPVSKGGCTVESNLQTLCWKCNRQKSSKVL